MTLRMAAESNSVHFGEGALLHLPVAIEESGATRAFIVTDTGLARTPLLARVTAVLERASIEFGVFTGVRPNPTPAIIDLGGRDLAAFGPATVIALGGGSSLDAAKGISLVAANPGSSARQFDYSMTAPNPGFPIVAVPTTAGTGSETNGWGVIDDPDHRCKIYIGDASTVPVACILDPALTVGLPPRQTAGTGIDAMTHAIEALSSRGSNPIGASYAHEAIRLISGSLRDAVRNGSDIEARSSMILGAHLAGLALTSCGLGLVHGIAHSVSAHVGAAHGEALAAVLVEVMAYNAPASVRAYASIAHDMSLPTVVPEAAIVAVRDLADDIGIRFTLGEFGVREDLVASIAAAAVADAVTSNNPITPTADDVSRIIRERL